jgi:phosphoribosyl 1,2-cyclic phosphodiesterase
MNFDSNIRLQEDITTILDGKKISGMTLVKTIVLPEEYADEAHLNSIRYSLDNTLEYLKQLHIRLLIMPLTVPEELGYHAGLKTDLRYADILHAEHTVLTHMASECDYDAVNRQTPDNIEPAFDNMRIDVL